jgi:drug/metabolite transporter (DMT)-like permease
VTDLLLLSAVFLLSLGQVLQKIGAMRRLASKGRPAEWAAALLSPELLAAGACMLAGTVLWLFVLSRMDVSRAFPFLSLSSALVVAASRLILGERVPVHRWAGVALIALGVALVART